MLSWFGATHMLVREPGERFLADNCFTDEEFYVTARFGSEARRKKIRHRCLVERRISD